MQNEYIIRKKTKSEVENNKDFIEPLQISTFEFYECILENKFEILNVIKDRYPKNHIFKDNGFKFSAFLFCFAYSKLVCEKYLKNFEIMNDYINKKFISKFNGEFCSKTYNENLSEFTIFYYILTSIFVKSDLHNEIDRLDYESEGANNKRYEYSFILKNGKKVNFEVKTITCDPLMNSELKLNLLKDGDLLYKTYFPGTNIEDYIDEEYICENNIISSNYRKTKKNIKKIREKFKSDSQDDINIGVLCINYGTSVEEFISYIYNEEYGLIKKGITFDNVDNLIIFSMSSIANSLSLDELYDWNHVLSICNNYNEIFQKLRIDKYIFSDGSINKKFKECVNDYYGIYKYIHRNGYVHIIPNYVDEETINGFFDSVQESKGIIDLLVDLDDIEI